MRPQTKIDRCNSLDELAEILDELESEWRVDREFGQLFYHWLDLRGVNPHRFPTFGGEEPEDILDTWSWDADRVMTVVEDGTFVLVTRDVWDARP